MRLFWALLLVSLAGAQTVDSPEVIRAKAEIEKLRSLVAAGAAPRIQLTKAESILADAEDSAVLRETLYGHDLTEAQCDEMIAAADRRLSRKKDALAEAQKLVDAKVAPKTSLEELQSDVERAEKERNLALSRANLTQQLAEMARAEEDLVVRLAQRPSEAVQIAERYDGDGAFNMAMYARVESAFEKRFGKTMPVSAMGETAVHKSLGFDHRGRVDVAIFPDTDEGVWLREYLTENKIPYFAFRAAVPGKATGAHIHIGPMSTRLKLGG